MDLYTNEKIFVASVHICPSDGNKVTLTKGLRYREINDLHNYATKNRMNDVIAIGDCNFESKKEIDAIHSKLIEEPHSVGSRSDALSLWGSTPANSNVTANHPFDGGFILNPKVLSVESHVSVIDINSTYVVSNHNPVTFKVRFSNV